MDTLIPLANILAPHRGLIVVIGSGGKSTLLAQGARALAASGSRVTIATTTHMYAPTDIPLVRTLEELDNALTLPDRPEKNGDVRTDRPLIAAIGKVDAATGKLSAPTCGVEALVEHADYVLVEADGAHGLPLKAHADHEPVIPKGAALTVLVVGAMGLGLPLIKVAHRLEVFCRIAQSLPNEIATPRLIARALEAEWDILHPDIVIVNQADDAGSMSAAVELARHLTTLGSGTVYAGSLRSGALVRLDRAD